MNRLDVENALETLTSLATREILAGLQPKNVTVTIPVCPGGRPQIVVTFNPYYIPLTDQMLDTL